jgi:hypothetical protein
MRNFKPYITALLLAFLISANFHTLLARGGERAEGHEGHSASHAEASQGGAKHYDYQTNRINTGASHPGYNAGAYHSGVGVAHPGYNTGVHPGYNAGAVNAAAAEGALLNSQNPTYVIPTNPQPVYVYPQQVAPQQDNPQ